MIICPSFIFYNESKVGQMQNIIMIFLEKVLEAIYFAVFLITGKNIKEKRLLFIGIMIFEYLMLKHFIHYSVNFQLAYTFMSYVNLKVIYKEKAQITDVFLFTAASIVLIVISAIFALLTYFVIKNYYICLILSRVVLYVLLIKGRYIIRNKYIEFCSLWNRHKNPKKIKSLTLRNISVIVFNFMFWLINLGMIICIATYKI